MIGIIGVYGESDHFFKVGSTFFILFTFFYEVEGLLTGFFTFTPKIFSTLTNFSSAIVPLGEVSKTKKMALATSSVFFERANR